MDFSIDFPVINLFSCSGKNFMLEVIDVLKGVGLFRESNLMADA